MMTQHGNKLCGLFQFRINPETLKLVDIRYESYDDELALTRP
jgi:hypothetical protein